MAGKTTGLGDRLFVGGYNLSGDIGAIDSISAPRGVLDDTGIDKLAMERLLSTKDGEISFTAFYNVDTDQAHPVLSALPTTDVGVLYCRGAVLGNRAAALIGKQIGYDPTRGSDGSFTFKVQALANGYGLEWGKQLTAGPQTDTTGSNGTGVDFAGGGSLAFGLQAYLQVIALTGTNVVVKLQESSDNGVGDAWADVTGGAFTSATSAPQTQRLQTARGQTVERYLRVVTSGTFTSATFAVMVSRNPVAVSF
jgi:hypothetical protein